MVRFLRKPQGVNYGCLSGYQFVRAVLLKTYYIQLITKEETLTS
jgi:hypothetical protein